MAATRTLPTVFASRTVFGIIPSTSRRNIAWNADGQCLIVTRQGVTIATPYLATTLPIPDATLQSQPKGEDEDDNDPDDLVPNASTSSSTKLSRPRTGEVKFWITPLGFDKGKKREDIYEWSEIGDELNGVIIDKDKERNVRAAVWSPPGVWGGPLVAVMASTTQVSIFAPGQDPYRHEYTEVADLTEKAIDLNDEIGMPGMLLSRGSAMEWSAPPELASMTGIDGSLLAIANRAGGIDFWATTDGAHFERAAQGWLPNPWAHEVTWNTWRIEGEVCTIQLALACTDGSIWRLIVRRTAVEAAWQTEVSAPECLSPPDSRAVTALEWFADDLLVWAKPGSVHFSSSPSGVHLNRVGNWAGCNALSPCVGMHLSGSTLTVILSTLTHHVVRDVYTEPHLAPPIDSLRLTLAARDVFMDCMKRRRRNFVSFSEQEFTAHTSGYASLDSTGDICAWMAEPVTFHNLDSATEVNRIDDFVLADLTTVPLSNDAIVAAIEGVLDDPPNLLHNSPLGVLLPHLLRVLVTTDLSIARELYALASKEYTSPPVLPAVPGHERALVSRQWGEGCPDSLRLRHVFASWCKRIFPLLAVEFGIVAEIHIAATQRAIAAICLAWAAHVVKSITVGPLDAQYLGALITAVGPDAAVDPALRAVAAETGAPIACPACGSAVEFSGLSAYCAKGHEWERCSVSHLLITSPEYLLCTVCPAVSLRPVAAGDDNPLVRAALEAAVDCPTCGGRWARAV